MVTAALDQVEIIAGEMCYNRWQINDLIRVGHPDIINPDVCKACGITEMDRIATIAQSHHVPLQPHNTAVTICTAASLHCLAAVTNAAAFLECTSLDAGPESPHRFFRNRVRIENGVFHVPEGPGHGLEINAEAVRAAVG